MCEIALEQLLSALGDQARLTLCDIDSDPVWLRKYDVRVPVVEVAGKWVSDYPLDLDAVLSAISDGAGRNRYTPPLL